MDGTCRIFLLAAARYLYRMPGGRIVATLFFLSLLLAAGRALGEDPPETDHEAAILQATERMWAALGEQDRDAFRAVVSGDWELYTAGGSIFDTERLFTVHEANIRGFELEAEDFEARIHGDLAWATYRATMTAESRGEPWGGRFLVTHLYERGESGWITVHTHETRVPDAD